MQLKILVIAPNGREHCLAQAYAKSKNVTRVFITPGNGLSDFTNKKIVNVPIPMTDIDRIIAFAKKEKVDLVDVPQEDCLAAGYIDRFEKEGISAFGPTQKIAELESSKEWSRNFMKKYKLPIPKFHTFSDSQKAVEFIKKQREQLWYIKASGLAFGKGAIRAETKPQAIDAIHAMKQFGKAGETFLVEECLVGEEFSFFAICDGKNYILSKSAQDHKTVFAGDEGPNTGGIGTISPTLALSKKDINEIEAKIIKPVLLGMKKEKRPYKGILYVGGMRTKSGIKIIEFNCRWGDPEAEVIIPSIQTEYTTLALSVVRQTLKKTKITFDSKTRIAVTGCSRGYPNDYSKVKGKEIFGLLDVLKIPGITVFGSGIIRKGKRFFANGGRIFHLVAEGRDVIDARKKAYGAMGLIFIEGNNLHFRTDIGWRDVQRLSLSSRT